MGFVLSKLSGLWTPAGYDEPDPATGISPHQKDIVQNTWKIVRQDSRKNGIALFMKYFAAHPEDQKLFPGFADVSMADLPTNKKLLAHSTVVMYALTSVIDNLDDTECLMEVLKKTGAGHRTRGVTREHFHKLANAVVSCLKDILGPTLMDARAEEAWRKSLQVANTILIAALEGKEES